MRSRRTSRRRREKEFGRGGGGGERERAYSRFKGGMVVLLREGGREREREREYYSSFLLVLRFCMDTVSSQKKASSLWMSSPSKSALVVFAK